jgi:hypothetical protein
MNVHQLFSFFKYFAWVVLSIPQIEMVTLKLSIGSLQTCIISGLGFLQPRLFATVDPSGHLGHSCFQISRSSYNLGLHSYINKFNILHIAFTTAGVNFINVLLQLLQAQILKAQKRQSSCQSFLKFRDLLAACVKATRRTLMILTPAPKSAKIKSSRQSFLRFASVKAASKMLLKSTPQINCV